VASARPAGDQIARAGGPAIDPDAPAVGVACLDLAPSDLERLADCLGVIEVPKFTVRSVDLEGLEAALADDAQGEAISVVFVAAENPQRGDLLVRHGARRPFIAISDDGETPRRALRARLEVEGFADVLRRRDLGADMLELVVDAALRRHRSGSQLAELRERFALAIQGAKDGMWEWDLARDRVFYSQRWREIFGFRAKDVGNTLEDWVDRIHPHDRTRVRADLEAVIRGTKPFHGSEHRIRDARGEYRWVLTRGVVQRNAEGQARRLAGSLTDISEYRQREDSLRVQSRHDAVTALPKREAFIQRIARALELARQYDDYNFAVLLVDIDRFRMINDSVGTMAADEVLGRVARRLADSVGLENTVARFSGDAFSILLENLSDPTEGAAVANDIHEAMREPFEIDGDAVYVTVSIGMTSSARNYDSVDDVLTDVGLAAGKAKRSSTDRNEIFDTQMRIEATTLLRLEMALREAVERQEFHLNYQPIYALDGGRLEGFEALIRWEHPTRGFVSPGEFIPIAENTGLIVPIGQWAMREAAQQVATWIEEFELPPGRLWVSVNLSGRQATDPELLPILREAIERHGLHPGSLKIELTESVLMENADVVVELLNGLRALGCSVFVDDFGTGYSSLSYLHRFPVDGLKIDKSFVDVLDGAEESATMVRTILGLARNFGLDVVAEGIEHAYQAEQLRDLGCPHVQGYFFSRPLRTADAYAQVAKLAEFTAAHG